jgi:hypothetical protein
VLDATLMNVRGGAGGEFRAGEAVHVGLPPDAAIVLTE